MTPRKKSVTRKAAAKRGSKKKVTRKKAAAKKKPAARKKKATAKKTTTRKTSKKAASKKKPARKKASAKKKVTRKKTSAKKKVTRKKAATKKKPAARKKAAGKKTAAKKKSATRKKTGSKKAAAQKKPAAKKTSSKKTRARKTPRGRGSLLSGPSTEFKPYSRRRGESYMNDAQLEHFREKLESWKRELMEEVDRTVHHMKDEAANFPDPNDRATQESEFSLELRTRDRERKLLRKIDSALQRIKDGSYGYCDETGEEIGLERLEARPVATLCLEAQERRELAEKQYRDDR